MELQDRVRQVLEMGREEGAQQTEAFAASHISLEVEARNGQVEAINRAQEQGVGVRAFWGQQMGFAYTSRLDPDSLRATVRQAVANAAQITPDDYVSLPEPQPSRDMPWLGQGAAVDIDVQENVRLALATEEAAHGYDPRVVRTEHADFEQVVYEVAIANSKGVDTAYRGSYCGGSVAAVAEEGGDVQTGSGVEYYLEREEYDPGSVGREAGAQAVGMLGARRVATQQVPIVLPPRVAVQFLDLVASALSADAVQKGRSLFMGREGTRVAAPGLTLIDDGTLHRGLHSSPVDGEGVPTERTVLVQDGVLQGFLHDTYTAARGQAVSTGNASRASYRGTPEVGTSNLFLEPGEVPVADLWRDLPAGFYLDEVLGMHTANPISGDFSLGAAGTWIEKGELAHPVRGLAVAGNMLELLESIRGIASDLRFFLGYGSPTLLAGPLTVSGE